MTYVPAIIEKVPNLLLMDLRKYGPGIYFLCKGSDVVYVGQSIKPTVRVATHIEGGSKKFDRAFLLLAKQAKDIKEELDDLEGAFIRMLRPVQNGWKRSGSEHLYRDPVGPRTDSEVFKAYGCDHFLEELEEQRKKEFQKMQKICRKVMREVESELQLLAHARLGT